MNTCLREVNGADVISTVTGTGTPGFNNPAQIAMDGNGNLYIADKDNHRIKKLDPSGGVTTVAGTGTPGYSGDGGPAVNAQLDAPNAVAVDASGHVYIADTNNCLIRKVDITTGTITRIAGKLDGGVPE